MSQNSLSPQDPKFTAYALGELDPKECATVEAALRDNPAARAAVEEIRMLAAQLSSALAAEPVVESETVAPTLPARAAIIAGRDPRKLDGGPLPYAKNKVIKFPAFYYITGLAAAACFAVFVAFQEPKPHPRTPAVGTAKTQEKTYTVLDLMDVASDASPSPTLKSDHAPGGGESVLVVPSVAPAAPELQLSLAERGVGAGVSERPATVTTSVSSQAAVSTAPLSAPLAEPFSATQAGSSLLTSSAAAEATIAPASNPQVPPDQLSNAASQAGGPVPLFDAGGVAFSGYKVSVDKDQNSYMRGIPVGPVGTTTAGGNNPVGGKQTVQLTPLVASTGDGEGAGRRAVTASGMNGGPQRFAPGESLGMPSEMLPARSLSGRPGGSLQTAENEFIATEQSRVSTFGLETDPAGYTDLLRVLESGRLPPAEAIRIEALVNHFPFGYPPPTGDHPIAASVDVASAPWAPTHRLVRIGLKAREIAAKPRAPANLVFLVDVSASMNEPNKLSLVKDSIRSLIGKMRPEDHVAIVTYAGQSGLALPSTAIANTREILDALELLQAERPSSGAVGIQLAYDIARANFVTGGPNRVILCTDGDFNVGIGSERELTRMISDHAKTGVQLSVLGFGTGKLKDALFEEVANHGRGDVGYVATRREADKLLSAQVEGRPTTVAENVKVQIDFNPSKVSSHRLIGYESRAAGTPDGTAGAEIHAGHAVTALYEVVPARDEPRALIARAKAEPSSELLTVRISYKMPGGFFSRKAELPVVDRGSAFANATRDFKFAAAVASFGMILRHSPHKGTAAMSDMLEWAAITGNEDSAGRRGDFVRLVNAARRLMP